jgi:hypothetical protein
MLFGCRIFFLMVLCKHGGEVDVEGCGRLILHDGLLGMAWFCVSKLSGSLAMECNFCGSSASALGDRRVCMEVV